MLETLILITAILFGYQLCRHKNRKLYELNSNLYKQNKKFYKLYLQTEEQHKIATLTLKVKEITIKQLEKENEKLKNGDILNV